MRRKVTFIESSSEMGGVEFSTLYLASHLNPEFWDVLVVCPGEGKLVSACRDSGVKTELVPMLPMLSTSFRVWDGDVRLPNPAALAWNGIAILVDANRLRLNLKKDKPDLVITKGLYAHLSGGLASRLAGLECIWHLQDLISERYGGLYRTLFGWLARLIPDKIVVDGKAIASQLPGKLQDRVNIILNGVDLQVFHPGMDGTGVRRELGISPDALVIGHAARITPWKGQAHLLEAFGKIAARHPSALLLLVGAHTFDNDHYEQGLRLRVRTLGLENRVIFTGFRADLPQVLAGMDIFAYPSVEKDTSPLALLSAMACGLPVVGFDIDGVREVLGGEEWLVSVGDEAGMAAALVKLMEDDLLRRQAGDHCREQAVARFSLEQNMTGMEAVFRS
jgi:glycosyltransferase involved in cell wall biosynthesis